MSFVLNRTDYQLLRSRGWMPSTSGHTFYGEDKDGKMWQATEDYDTRELLFRTELADGLAWGALTTMSREKYDELWPVKNYPKADTGD
jgi:hypothetical protein